ncbi:MAG: C_GCAxxG_C_C family protein, partial [Clostridia bacterium]|nr:C_GCAxxG_C_C family protein [Clostridia bacterium]
ALLISSPFGGGMGRMREVCGALSGAYMALGLICGYDDGEAKAEKAELYGRVREIADRFKERNGGTIICRELLPRASREAGGEPTPRNDEFYKTRPCVRYVRTAAEILDGLLTDAD